MSVPFVASVKMPPKDAADQPIVPLNTALVLPASAPLSTVNEPLGFTVNGPFSASVWPLSESVTVPAPLVPRMIAPTVVPLFSETVTPALVIMAVSLAPGTAFGFQLTAVFQPPLAELVQLMMLAPAGRRLRENTATDKTNAARRVFIGVAPSWFRVVA